MTYVPNFPTNNTFINQSVGQIQSNWNFLSTSIGTDHFFNVGGVTEGHHRFVQLVSQLAVTPAVAPGCIGVLFSRTTGTGLSSGFYINTATNLLQIPVVLGLTINIPGAGTFTAVDFTPVTTPQMGNFVFAMNGNPNNQASGTFYYDGNNVYVTQTSIGGIFTGVGGNGTKFITLTSTGVAANTKIMLTFIQL